MGVDPAEHRSRVAAWSGYRQLLVAALLSGLVLSMAPVAAGGETYVPLTATTTLPDGPPAALPVTQPDRLGTDTNVYGSGVVRSSPSGMVAQSGGSSAGGLCDTSGVGQFTDVASGDYGAAYILCLRALGVSVGTGGGGFGPDQTLTRGQMASFLVRLWRDVLGRACPGGGTPFSDVAGSVHEDNIACIYNLGITVGTTTTTYSPQDELTASQISRFLLRTYQKAGNNCPDRGSELDEAVDCLLALNVIPDAEQGKSALAVVRSQMAVYVIGLWHNVSGRGLPPEPPGPGSDRLKPIPEELANQANVVTTGRMELPVYICARAGRYTIAHLRSATDRLNQKVGSFFRDQSSGQADVQFVTGGIVSPDLDWDGITFQTLWRTNDDPCSAAAIEQEAHRQLVVLADVRIGGNIVGYASASVGPAVQPMAYRFWSETVYLDTVAHEVGHSRFGFCHPHDTYGQQDTCPLYRYHNDNVYDPADRSIMSYSGTDNIDTTHISCAHRAQAGWPPGPLLPNGGNCTGSGTGPGQADSSPNSPWDLTVFPGDRQLIAQWEPPFAFEDGSWQWLTSYTVSISDGRGNLDQRTVSDTRVIIGGLTNGVTYTIEVTANNEVGSSQPATATGIPMSETTVPGPPTNVSVTPLDQGLGVGWRQPLDDGGSPVTGFILTVDDGTSAIDIRHSRNTSGTGVGDLTNGQQYTITVQAQNRNGDGPPSAPITAIPMAPGQGVPAPPTRVEVVEGDRELTVTWYFSSDDGGSPITGYTVTADDGSSTTSSTVGPRTRTYQISRLTNGVEYTIGVTANNSVGSSQPAGTRGTPLDRRQEVLPGVPTNVRVVAGDRELTVTWSPPSDDGSLTPVTGYVVTARRGSSTSIYTVGWRDRSYRIGELTNGRRYTVTVYARNGSGDGSTSTPIVATPAAATTTPGPPTDVQATPGNRQLTVSWSPPDNDGGSPVTGYVVIHSDGVGEAAVTLGSGTRSYRIGGLTNNAEYTIWAHARNRSGDGSTSTPIVATPAAATTTPGPPTDVQATPGNRQLTVSWSPPDNDGGSPVTGYVVIHSDGVGEAAVTLGSGTRSYRIGGLTNNAEYTIWVHARNRHGDGPTSAPIGAFPMGEALPPDRPVVTAVARGNRIEASWSAADNGAPVDRWRIGGVGEVNAGTTSYTWADQSPGAYTIRVRAHNVAGWSPWAATSVTVAADPTVAISRGNAGPTSGADVNQAPCAANDSSCRWINVSVRGFPQGRYTGRCIHQGFRWPNGNVSAGGWWKEFNIDVGASGQATLTNPCYITFSALRGDGAHISVNLNGRWIDSNTLPADTNFVLLSRGGPGPRTAPRPGSIPCAANAPDCRWLQIELRNFPPGQYRVYCAHDGWNNGQDTAGSWHNFETTIGTNGGVTITNTCYINIPNTDGRGVRIHVGKTGLPSGQYRWSSNWLR